MRILFAGGGTGGHLYPGLAIARAVQRLDPSARPYFIGARRGIERDVLPASGFPHRLLDLHPLYRSRPWQNWRTILGFARAWREIGIIAREERPAAVVGTGGYAAAATCAWGAAHGIPVALQEQNSFAGITARLIARFAREIYLGYGEAARSLHPRRGAWMQETGNPIEPPPSPRPPRDAARRAWEFPASARVLLVTGGSQGARVLNEVVGAWIERGLPNGLHVIWATGKASYEQYAPLESTRVRVRPYLSPIADAYAAADLALTRAGALTLAELCAWGIPGILVPLPTAAADHQTANARALAASGAARELPQRDLDVERLDREVRTLLGDLARLEAMQRAALARGRPEAAETIARRVLALARA
ncbi:MAG TPA: UDP-N-acetylglucosamine--N-acetylmuramyl-(pentapeptide) pyrophosphoryl-undecaprenol N-acetylglucosamine transferase [Gemmatimonadaceae bacterium]|nr:UDP-N-acetylglucosamine--N-acetylmuramyl-(pentapeptide) pyrophosphoryl-undecaprenol N-acetylglucosamine transferase [Gemmatimonadaceae bacterium]